MDFWVSISYTDKAVHKEEIWEVTIRFVSISYTDKAAVRRKNGKLQ